MGLYPTTDFSKEGDLLVRTYNDFSGAVRKTYYQPILEIEDRKTCYCCSCDDHMDYFCRNHGGPFGSRPCEVHNMPGSGEDPDTGEEFPLESVQWMAALSRWYEGEGGLQNHPQPRDTEEHPYAPHSHWPREVDPGNSV